MIRKLLAGLLTAAALTAGLLGATSNTAGATSYNVCPAAWWIHSNAGSGTVMQCVIDSGNHAVIRQWIGGVDGGVVYNSWHPWWLVWTLYPASGATNGSLLFCSAGNGSMNLRPPADGWEHQWYSGVYGGPAGHMNHFHGWAGVQPFGAEHTPSGSCPGGGSSGSSGVLLADG